MQAVSKASPKQLNGGAKGALTNAVYARLRHTRRGPWVKETWNTRDRLWEWANRPIHPALAKEPREPAT